MAREQSSSRRFRFVNLDGSEPQAFGAVFKWGVVDRLLGRRRRGSVASPAPRVEPNLEEPERPPAPGEPARLIWIGHASWLIQLDGVSLLIDPILFDSIGPGIRRFVPPGVPLAALPAIDLGWLASGYARTGSSQAIRCSKSHDRGSRVAKENTRGSIRSRMKSAKTSGDLVGARACRLRDDSLCARVAIARTRRAPWPEEELAGTERARPRPRSRATRPVPRWDAACAASFNTAAMIARATNCVAWLPTHAARRFEKLLGLCELRSVLPTFEVGRSLVWHDRTHADPGAVCFRDIVVRSLRDEAPRAGTPRCPPSRRSHRAGR
jgi:hypothetical protein